MLSFNDVTKLIVTSTEVSNGLVRDLATGAAQSHVGDLQKLLGREVVWHSPLPLVELQLPAQLDHYRRRYTRDTVHDAFVFLPLQLHLLLLSSLLSTVLNRG